MKFFKSKTLLPKSGKTIYISQIQNQEFVELQKYLFENDDEQIADFFEHLLVQHCDVNANKLYNIDKFTCLLKLRSMSCGDVINFTMNSSEINMSLSMVEIINKLFYFKTSEQLKYTISPDVHAIIDCSTNLFFAEDDAHFSMVKQIVSTNSATVDVSELSNIQKQMLFNSIDSSIIHSINRYIANSSQSICIVPSNESLQIGEVSISPFNNTMFEFIKFIFKDDLFNAYKMMYVLSSKANIDMQSLNAMAPVEQQMYAKFLIEDIEEQNRQLKETSSNLNTPT
jgi:hypothetical protein